MKKEEKIDSHLLPKDLNKNLNKEERKEIYKKVKAGELTDHKQAQTYNNLIPLNQRPPEEQKAIRQKAYAKMKEVVGEKKSAKESLETLLPIFANDTANDENIPKDIRDILDKNKDIKVTQYDLIMLSMINQARNGNTRAAEFIRDTYGDKPINETHNVNEIITEADKALIDKIGRRLGVDQQ